MQIVVVHTEQQAADFLNFPTEIYRGDKQYIRPLDKDIEEVFDQEK